MKKLLLKILAGLVVLLVVLFLCRNFIARVSVEVGARKMTGFPLTIGSVDVGLFSSKLDVHDVKLMNPSDFPDKMFVDMPQLYIDYRFGSMLSGSPHVNEMLINIKQLVVVKNNKGESNAQKLNGVVSSGGDSSSKYTVDKLRVHVGTVTIKDYTHAKPTERNTTLNIDATYNNITDSTDITRLVLLTVMGQVRLPELGLKPEDLTKGLENVAGTAGEAIGIATEGIFDTIKKVVPQPDQNK